MSEDKGPTEGAVEPPAKLGRTFWLLNVIEMFERLGYFMLRVMAPIYIAQKAKTNPGGLNLTQSHKGTIYAWWAIFQSGLPIFTGGYADRFGYKNILALSIALNFFGYMTMAFLHSYIGFFAGVLLLATGTAFFKPSLQGSLAQSLDKNNASTGWGVFYWVVNIGSVIAHYIAGPIAGDKSQAGWRRLMFAGAAATLANLGMLFTFRDVPSGGDKNENLLQVAKRTLVNIAEARLITWLLIMSCFWLMMYQLWDLMPNYIEDWFDSSNLAAYLPSFMTEPGDLAPLRVRQTVLISTNSVLVVAFVVPVSWLVRKMRTLSAMLIGMLMATAGVYVASRTPNAGILLLGIVGFSFGEMLTGPKKQEYLGLIAPPGKKGLYLGYVNIPVGLGVGIGSKLAGYLYGNWGERSTLSLKYLMEHTPFGHGKAWDGSVATLEKASGITAKAAFQQLQSFLNIDAPEAARLLWETYTPYKIWYVFVAIGVVAAIALYIFGQLAKRWKDMNA